MSRYLQAVLLGLTLALAQGFIATHSLTLNQITKGGTADPVFAPRASLPMMMDGTAYQPFVRRQLVPFLLHGVDAAAPHGFKVEADQALASSRFLHPFLFCTDPGQRWHSLVCLMIWFLAYTVFASLFAEEAHYYAAALTNSTSALPPGLNLFLQTVTVGGCLFLVPLLHNNYIYDPLTLAFSMFAVRAVRLERFWQLLTVTALFALNRETAFIVPGLVFFYWLYRRRPGLAVQQAAVLSVAYLAITASLVHHFRHNPGFLAEDNFAYLMTVYTHRKLPFALFALLTLAVYAAAVFRSWKYLPAPLKAVQWFVPLWVFMHIRWGWPMEWRVFLEVYPGMLLTIVAARSGSAAFATLPAPPPTPAPMAS